MKTIAFLICLSAFDLVSQSDLYFNKRFTECEDHWVAFKMDKDSNYTFGFIYIDASAGLTFNHEGSFNYKTDGKLKVEKLESANIKMRLQPNNVKVAFIPESMFKELQIDTIPKWLQAYKSDTGTVERLYKWGYMYNGWGECSKGLKFLTQAHDKNPKYEGLAVELAFSYNCLGQYDMAEKIMKNEIESDPENAYFNKEYIYALINNNKVDLAIAQYKTSLKKVKENTYNAENCYNLMHHFYTKKDKENFKIWYKEMKKWPIENKLMLENANRMKDSLK